MSKLMMLVAAKWREFTARGQDEEEEEMVEEEELEPEPVQVSEFLMCIDKSSFSVYLCLYFFIVLRSGCMVCI